jgi:hypothetical protein
MEDVPNVKATITKLLENTENPYDFVLRFLD